MNLLVDLGRHAIWLGGERSAAPCFATSHALVSVGFRATSLIRLAWLMCMFRASARSSRPKGPQPHLIGGPRLCKTVRPGHGDDLGPTASYPLSITLFTRPDARPRCLLHDCEPLAPLAKYSALSAPTLPSPRSPATSHLVYALPVALHMGGHADPCLIDRLSAHSRRLLWRCAPLPIRPSRWRGLGAVQDHSEISVKGRGLG